MTINGEMAINGNGVSVALASENNSAANKPASASGDGGLSGDDGYR